MIRGLAAAGEGPHRFNLLNGECDAWLAAATAVLLARLPDAA